MTIDEANGLSNDRVSSIVNEKNGFVWIGTDSGLNRYDGNNIANASFSIVDILGKTIVQSKALNNDAIGVSNLRSWVYILSVSSEEEAKQFKFQKK